MNDNEWVKKKKKSCKLQRAKQKKVSTVEIVVVFSLSLTNGEIHFFYYSKTVNTYYR